LTTNNYLDIVYVNSTFVAASLCHFHNPIRIAVLIGFFFVKKFVSKWSIYVNIFLIFLSARGHFGESMEKKRNEKLTVYLSLEEKKLISVYAKKIGLSPNEFLRMSGLERIEIIKSIDRGGVQLNLPFDPSR